MKYTKEQVAWEQARNKEESILVLICIIFVFGPVIIAICCS